MNRRVPVPSKPVTKSSYNKFIPRAKKYARLMFGDGADPALVSGRLIRSGSPKRIQNLVANEYLFWKGRTESDLKLARYASWVVGAVVYVGFTKIAPISNLWFKFLALLPIWVLTALLAEWTIRKIWGSAPAPEGEPEAESTDMSELTELPESL